MTRGFVLKGIALPLVCALISAAILFALISANAEDLFPVPKNAQLAYHDELKLPEEPAGSTADGLKSGDLLGTITGSAELPLRYDAGYSSLSDCASVSTGSAVPGKIGCIYVKVSPPNLAKITTGEEVTITTADGEFNYEFTGEQLMESENAVLSLAPAQKQSLIVYYRVSNGIGLTTDYYALIYKGVS